MDSSVFHRGRYDFVAFVIFFLFFFQTQMDSRKRANMESTSDDALSQARIKELEVFKLNFQRVWGALSVEEVALLAKTERVMLEQNPGGYLSKLHDALFSRKSIEDAKAKHRAEMDAMTERVRLAEENVPRMKEELTKAQRLLSDQTQLQAQHSRVLEEKLAIAQQDLQRCESNWRHTGQQKEALEAKVTVLEREKSATDAEVARLKAEVTTLHADDNLKRLTEAHRAEMIRLQAECEARRKADLGAMAASLYEQMRAKGRC